MSFTLNSGFNAEFIKLDIRAILKTNWKVRYG